MPTKQEILDYKSAMKVWQDQQDAYMALIDGKLYDHRNDSLDTEISIGSNPEPPKNPPPHPPG